MRRILLCLMFLVLGTSVVFSANFSPTLMKLSAPGTVQYDFDNSKLQIPVTVSGVGGESVFFVYTKDIGESVNKVKNGHLGWHYVNKIDTCVYVSSAQNLSVGGNIIEWSGKNDDGGTVPSGEYYYYVWAFDNTHTKTPAFRTIALNGWIAPNIILTKDESGNPLDKPVFMTSGGNSGYDLEDAQERIHKKWVIGNDPDDATLVETTSVMSWRDNATISVLPTDHTMWFKPAEKPNGVALITKYKWIPNGASEIQTEWATGGTFEWTLPAKYTEFHFASAIVGDGNYLVFPNMNHQTTQPISDMVYLDLEDGSYVQKVDMSDIWINVDEGAVGGFVSGGPTDFYPDKQGNLSLNMHGTCLVHVMDPMRDGDIWDQTLYINGNGDSFLDTNWAPDAARPWCCNDPFVAIYKYGLDIDANGMSAVCTDGAGAISFGLVGPDGTGAGYFAYVGETINKGKRITHFIDYDSAFDGLYSGNASMDADKVGLFFTGHDSIKGVITSNPVAVENAPAVFSVAQNSPNPFNPATTIGFTLAEAGNVTVDVFNVAGQKIDTVASEFMGAGSHSVTWNASGLSAGVYFYTVKAGNFSKTMKMTLLK